MPLAPKDTPPKSNMLWKVLISAAIMLFLLSQVLFKAEPPSSTLATIYWLLILGNAGVIIVTLAKKRG